MSYRVPIDLTPDDLYAYAEESEEVVEMPPLEMNEAQKQEDTEMRLRVVLRMIQAKRFKDFTLSQIGFLKTLGLCVHSIRAPDTLSQSGFQEYDRYYYTVPESFQRLTTKDLVGFPGLELINLGRLRK